MKGFLILLGLTCIVLITSAERNTILLKENLWYTGKESVASLADLKNSNSNFKPLNFSKQILQKEGQTLNTIIDLSSDKTILSIEDGSRFFDVWVDGKQLKNLRQDEMFLSEIQNESESSELILSLVMKKGVGINIDSLHNILKNISLTALNGVTISWFKPGKDSYFGCVLLEIHILNNHGKDIDGKLIARIYKPLSSDLIAENNNCAFSRNGIETVIEVIFPGTQETLVKGKYFAEVLLVDKEKNEEVVDQVTSTIKLE